MALYRALTAVLLFAAQVLAQVPSKQRDLVAEGMQALDAKQPAVAESLLRQAVSADANDFPAHFNLALALSLQDKDAEAIQELRRTIELKADLYPAYTNLGTILLRDKKFADAVPVLQEAVRLKPDNARANQLYAQALLETGDAPQAEKYYRASLDQAPKSAPAEAGMARSLLRQMKLPEAAEHFHAAAALDPQYKDGLLELASAYEKSGNAADAIAVYREFPENAAAKERIAALLVSSGNMAGAIPALEAAVQATPSVANRLALADAYKANKQSDNAIVQLQLAVATEPANYDLHMDLGRELRDQRKLAPAAQQFAAAAKIRPESVKAWNELAAVLVVSEDYAGGLAALDRVRALGKEVPGDLYYRAISLEKLRQPKPAMEAYRQFLATDGGKLPDQEFLARQRIRIIENELNRR